MPRFYCDYCDAYLTHDSMSGRQQHMRGWKHRENFKLYYQAHFPQWMMEQQMYMQMQMQNSYAQGLVTGFLPPAAGFPGPAEAANNENSGQGPAFPQGGAPMCMPSNASSMPVMPGQPPVFRAPPSMAPPTVG